MHGVGSHSATHLLGSYEWCRDLRIHDDSGDATQHGRTEFEVLDIHRAS